MSIKPVMAIVAPKTMPEMAEMEHMRIMATICALNSWENGKLLYLSASSAAAVMVGKFPPLISTSKRLPIPLVKED